MQENHTSFKTAAILDNLEEVQAFASQQAKAMGMEDALLSKIELVIEELFVNIATHAPPGPPPDVEIACATEHEPDGDKRSLCISLRDWGPAFNPLEATPPPIDLDVDDRPIGGLGVFLVTQMADHCEYERQGDSNLFTACFNF